MNFTLISLILFLASTPSAFALNTMVKDGRENLLQFENHKIIIPPFVFDKFYYKADTISPAMAFNLPKLGLIVIGFQARIADDTGVPASFVLLGTKIEGGKFRPIQYMNGNDHFNKIEMYDLDADGVGEIFLWSSGGAHHQDVGVYKIFDKKLVKIFEAGSACGIDGLKDNLGRLSMIKIYHEKLDVPSWSEADCPSDRYEVWTWQKNKFVFNKNQSTDRPAR